MPEGLQQLVNTIVGSTAGLPDPATLASWKPALSGEIDILIQRDGRWIHEGKPIHREGLVRLFAALLRREADGQYYLLTPAEKWHIRVERHALQVIDCERHAGRSEAHLSEGDRWLALLNTGGRCQIDAEHRLHSDGEDGEPYMELPNGLSAQLTRSAWYRLVESASQEGGEAFITSDGVRISLGRFE